MAKRQRTNRLTAFGLAVVLAAGLPAQSTANDVSIYNGPCDASAAVALDAEHFVVGNDERNTLQVYRRGQAAGARLAEPVEVPRHRCR